MPLPEAQAAEVSTEVTDVLTRFLRVAFPQRPIIHTQNAGRGKVRLRLTAQQAQQRVPADPQAPRVAEAYPRCPAQRHAEGHQALGVAQRAARPGGSDGRQPFGEDATAAATIGAKPFANAQLERHPILRPGQVCQGAPVVTMDTPRWSGAERTGRADLGRLHAQGDLRRGVIDLTRLEAQRGRIGQQTGQDGRGWCRDESGLLLLLMMSLGQRSVCVPTASGCSRMDMKIYTV
jgi:hypothetical protein